MKIKNLLTYLVLVFIIAFAYSYVKLLVVTPTIYYVNMFFPRIAIANISNMSINLSEYSNLSYKLIP